MTLVQLKSKYVYTCKLHKLDYTFSTVAEQETTKNKIVPIKNKKKYHSNRINIFLNTKISFVSFNKIIDIRASLFQGLADASLTWLAT